MILRAGIWAANGLGNKLTVGPAVGNKAVIAQYPLSGLKGMRAKQACRPAWRAGSLRVPARRLAGRRRGVPAHPRRAQIAPGIEPDQPLTAEDLKGLPLPEKVWED
jgi:hypothetical protein